MINGVTKEVHCHALCTTLFPSQDQRSICDSCCDIFNRSRWRHVRALRHRASLSYRFFSKIISKKQMKKCIRLYSSQKWNELPSGHSINQLVCLSRWIRLHGQDHRVVHIVKYPVSNKTNADLFDQTKSMQTSHRTTWPT